MGREPTMKVSFLMVFILAHLTGDFVLQTDKIAKIKSTSVKGVAVHSGIITAVQMLFLGIFGLQGVLLGAVCGILHFLIDYMKGIIGKTLKAHFGYFVLDQMLHFSIIALLAFLFTPTYTLFSVKVTTVKILIIIIVLVFVSTVFTKMLLRDFYESVRNGPFFKKHERLVDAIFCSAVFLSILLPLPVYILLPVFLAIAAFGCFLYTGIMRFRIGYSFSIATTKYFIYVVIAFSMLLFLRLG
jgi:hypothetical protein